MSDFVNDLIRSRTARGSAQRQEDNALTDAADRGLDMAVEGLASMHAAIDELTNELGTEVDEKAPMDVESAFHAAVDAVIALRDAVDEELVDAGLPPTTAEMVTNMKKIEIAGAKMKAKEKAKSIKKAGRK
jgi:hypothetical protein